MRRLLVAMVLVSGFPMTLSAAVGVAANARDDESAPLSPSTDPVSRDYLRAATPDASPLSRLVLSRALEMFNQPGMPERAITAAQWQPIRDRAVRDGRDDPMVQAVFLIGNRSAKANAASRDHAVDLLTRHVGDNGQFGLVLLALPEVAGDAQVERDILHQAARARAFDSPYTATQHALAADLTDFHWTRNPDTRAGTPAMADEVRSATIASALAAVDAISQIGPIFKLCQQATGVVRDDCQLLGQRLFEHAETAIDATVALRLIEMTAPDQDVVARAANERRRFEWQSDQLQTLWANGNEDTPSIRGHLERQGRTTEMDAMRQTLVALNLPLEPPAHWRTRAERLRTPAQ